MLRGLVTAARTLTSLPVPGREADRFSSALPWFPLVGFALGLAAWGLSRALCVLCGRGWPGGEALVIVLAGVLLTRALHLDGLADWADGFWGGRDREHTLQIMKDPRVGSFGVTAVVCVLLAKWVCLERLARLGTTDWVLAACAISRLVHADLVVSFPYARREGGTGSPFWQGAGRRHLLLAAAVCAALLFAWFRFDWNWSALLALGLLTGRLLGYVALRRLGGVTGDLLGAFGELVETVLLAVAAVVLLP